MAKQTRKPVKKNTPKVRKPTPKTSSTDALIKEALKNKATADVIRSLNEMKDIEERERKRMAFISAVLDFQNEVPDLPRTAQAKDDDGKVYYYTPLPIIKKHIQPLLKKYGFIYRWDFRPKPENKIECTCILAHIEGHESYSSMITDSDESVRLNNIQSIGSAQSYMQRYTLIAVLGLTTANADNDGATSPQKPSIPGPEAISNKREELEKLELEELSLQMETIPEGQLILADFITEKYNPMSKSWKPSDKQAAEIKKFIIDTYLKNSISK